MPLKPPYRELQVLKRNAYKCVRLLVDDAGARFIAKRYTGHAASDLERNARHAFEMLHAFRREFGDIVTVPQPYEIDAAQHEVHLEYIPDLQRAVPLTRRSLPIALPFFERCLDVDPASFGVQSMEGSTMCTDGIVEWFRWGGPVALGLKGDLWHNLVLAGGRLLLADVDSAAAEPLGLSELVLAAEIVSSSRVVPRLLGALKRPPPLAAASRLDAKSFARLLELSLDVAELRMAHLNRTRRRVKRALASRVLSRAVGPG